MIMMTSNMNKHYTKIQNKKSLRIYHQCYIAKIKTFFMYNETVEK